jgi:DNA primase
MEVENMGFVEAIKHLGGKLGIAVETRGEEDPLEKEREAYFNLGGSVVKTFQHFLWEKPEGQIARDFLVSRGIGPELGQKFDLGYSPNKRGWMHQFLQKKNYSPEFLQKSGLFSQRKPDYHLFQGRLIFPIIDHRQRVLGFGGRLLESEGPKYINSPETPYYQKRENLYGINLALEEIRRSRSVYICEGYIDVLAIHAAGVSNVVAPLGTAFTPEQGRFLKKYVDQVHFLFDMDEAGQRAMEKSLRIAEELELESSVVVLEEQSDPGDYLKENRLGALKKFLKYPINSFDYLLEKAAVASSSESSAKELTEWVRRLYHIVEGSPSKVRREFQLKKISEALGLSEAAIRGDFKPKQQAIKESKPIPHTPGRGVIWSNELYFVVYLFTNPQFAPLGRRHLTTDDFQDSLAKRIFELIEDASQDSVMDLEEVFSQLNHPELHKSVLEKVSLGEFSLNPERVIDDGIRKIKESSLKRKLEGLLEDLALLDQTGGAFEDRQRFLYEIEFVRKQIGKLRSGQKLRSN